MASPPTRPTEVGPDTPRLDDEAIPTSLSARAANWSPSPGPVGVVGGSGARLTRETDMLRRKRLQAAAVFFLAALSLFLVWRLAFSDDRSLWPLNVATLAALGGLLALLSDPRPISPRRMAAIEIAMFGLLAALMAGRQYLAMRSSVLGLKDASGHAGWTPPRASAVQVAVKDAIIVASIVSFSYGMLIPNSWRRAAVVVLTLMMVPVATQIVLFGTLPGAWRQARQVATLASLSENVLYVIVASGLAIYGTHVINILRVEAFQARQLNQYLLGDCLGAGGMGEVYRAEHRMLKRPCAIKLIKPDRARDALTLARFAREVRATAKLSHPNTIEIYDYGHTDRGQFYYVMELLRGMTLEALVDRFGPMPAGRVVYLLRQSCDALSEAHAAGLVHRDLKPGNIFAAFRGGRHDVAKILDFGLVQGGDEGEAPALSREGMVRGTPHYMAPEQALAEPGLDARCDLYAMGAVAYFLLTGGPPFEGDSATRIMIGHARDPVVPPSLRNPEVPADLEAVVMRCLAKSRDARYPTADALADALAACACVPDWDAHRAALWWRVADPNLM